MKFRKDRTWVCLVRELTLSWSLNSIWILQQNAGGHSRPWESCGSIEASGCCHLNSWWSSATGSTQTDYSNQGSGTHHSMSLVHDLKPLLNFVRCRDWSAEKVSIQKNIMAGLIILPSKHVILQLDTALIYDTMLCTKFFYQINIFHTGIQIFLWSLIYCPFFLCMVQRFLPSEFGNDPERSVRTKPTDVVFQSKVKIRNAIKAAGIPYTFVNSNSFASYFLSSLGQRELTTPPRDKLTILGDGNAKGLSSAHPFVCWTYNSCIKVHHLRNFVMPDLGS